MCYDIKANLNAQLKTAKYYNDDPELIGIMEEKIGQLEITEFHHVSGFQHPRLPVVVNEPGRVRIATWGLLPFWIKDLDSGLKFYNKTLNARSETIFEKPTFRDAATEHRCILMVNGFYEHHHKKGRTFPFFIRKRSGEPFPLACLFSQWKSKDGTSQMDTFSIVTTSGNPMMARIHNHPKLAGPRMPVILPEESILEWIGSGIGSEADEKSLIDHCCRPYPEEEMEAFTVHPLRGKNATGNTPAAHQKYVFPEFPEYRSVVEGDNDGQGTLF